MAAHRVRALLMGGQACVFYGAAEFSRDTDLLILADAENLGRLEAALRELQAECIAVPPFAAEYLERGHAVHWPELARSLAAERPLLTLAQPDKLRDLDEALAAEERAEREQDRLYWQPLKTELEQLRQAARKR